jgi:hypothetical protein
MQNQQIESLKSLPATAKFVLCNGAKEPIKTGWLQQRLGVDAAIQAFGTHLWGNQVCSLGILLGEASGGILGVDIDGHSAVIMAEQLSSMCLEDALPPTVAATSGKPGRSLHLYRAPVEYWTYCETKNLPTGVPGEQLELRWAGSQSIIYGAHPETGGYRWVEGQSPTDTEIADCPGWIIRQVLNFAKGNSGKRKDWGDREWALSYLTAIPSAEDYDQWLKVGMALKSVDEDLLDVWTLWSQLAENHKPGECLPKWESFRRDGVGIGTLADIAKLNGWRGNSPVAHQGVGDPHPAIDPHGLEAELARRNADFDLRRLFHPTLCAQLESIARTFNQPVAVVAAPLLSIGGSLLPTGALVHISCKTNHSQPPIIWTALVGDSDDGKSPILKILTKPLVSMQAEAWKVFQQRKAEWEADLADWEGKPKKERGPKPKCIALQRFTFDNFTQESIGATLQYYPEQGALVCVDELAGMFMGFNQYRKTGNDRQAWLSLYDGGKIDITRRTSDPIFIERTNLPVVGGIQPIVLRDVMGKLEHVDGFWPRFFYARMQNSRMPVIDFSDDADTGLNDTLTAAYRGLYRLPAMGYRLSLEARRLWETWHGETENCRFQHDHPATKTLFRKARARAARIALVAHCLNAAINGAPPGEMISAETLRGAIEYTQWGLNQILSLYADYGVTDSPEMVRVAKFVQDFKDAGWLPWLRVRAWWSTTEKPNQKTCLAFMTNLVNLGQAISNGQDGGKMQIRIKEFSHKSQTPPQSLTDKDLGLVTNLVTVTKNLVTDLQEPDSVTKNLVTVTKTVTNQNPCESVVSPTCDYVTKNIETETDLPLGDSEPVVNGKSSHLVTPLQQWPPKQRQKVWVIEAGCIGVVSDIKPDDGGIARVVYGDMTKWFLRDGLGEVSA